jgi:hypothetical protein
MRRGLTLALAIAVLIVAPAADAAKPRKYTGALGEGSITLWATKAKVTKIVFGGFRLYCDDGDSYVYTSGTANGAWLRYGAFVFSGRTDSGASSLDMSGIVGRKRAKGTLQLVQLFNDQDQLDPNGSIRCETTLGWRAKRVRKKGRR